MRARRCGHLVIEELIESHDDERRMIESPESCLGAQTASGEEQERSAR